MREYQHSLIHIWYATSILSVACNFVVIPLGIITKNVPALVLGIIEAIPIVGGVFTLLVLGVGLVPSFARLFDVDDSNAHAYWKKEVACASYPFSIDFFLHADKLYESTDWCILHVCNNLMKQKPLGDFLQVWMFGDKS